jgi:hypothetical protein
MRSKTEKYQFAISHVLHDEQEILIPGVVFDAEVVNATVWKEL